MDAEGRIYRAEDVPAEDQARLDGYLRGRAEADALKREHVEAMEAQLRKMEAERSHGT